MSLVPDERFSHVLLWRNDLATPLGALRLAGEIHNGKGVETYPEMRVYGRYAVVCILRGKGRYVDVRGKKHPVSMGDVILVFPELAHYYGPPSSGSWDELYVTFEGPVFDLWRQLGLLDIREPVISPPNRDWSERLRSLIMDSSLLTTGAGRLTQINRLLLLLGELVGASDGAPPAVAVPEWVVRAQANLDINLRNEQDMVEIAATVGMSYETFRKRFLQATGMTPIRYRLHRRIAAACELLRYSPQMTNRQAAEALGFADEFHFSRRFTQVMGISPRAYRRQREGAPIDAETGDSKIPGGNQSGY